MRRQPITTKIEDIVNYWSTRIDESDLSTDAAEMHEHCWRCGCKRNLERCHIIPASRGGEDTPSNLVLLCKRCHADGPNVTDPEIMWDWLYAYSMSRYDTFWGTMGVREYRVIYGRSMKEDITFLDIAKEPDALESFNKQMAALQEQATQHFGQPQFNSATLAGMFRMLLKEIAEEKGVELPSAKYSNRSAHKLYWDEINS
jgi:hypothetical protein